MISVIIKKTRKAGAKEFMVEQSRKKGESFESFLRRFNRTLIGTRKLTRIRGSRFLKKKPNKATLKKNALYGKDVHEKAEYLKKIGKITEDKRRRW